MNKKAFIVGGILIGLLLIIVAVVYFVEPAKALPSFLPGYDPLLSSRHIKHGIGALLLGLAAFAFAWFQSGKKSSSQHK